MLTAPDTNYPVGIVLDSIAGKMYWTEAPQKTGYEPASKGITGRIRRANLDGSEYETLVSEVDEVGLGWPYGIALDVAAGKMYWADRGTGKIQRANLDGSGAETLVAEFNEPIDVALDVAAGKMYWTESGQTTTTKSVSNDCAGKIRRANLDGSDPEDVQTELCGPVGIALDVAAGKMYWTESGQATTPKSVSSECTGKIRRANLDGSGDIDDVVENLCGPLDIALDVDGGKMYWTSGLVNVYSQLATTVSPKIQRANLNGSEVQTLLDENNGLNQPKGIALYLAATLTANTVGLGNGTGMVTSEPGGISCGENCTWNFAKGTVVTLRAHPGVKSYFVEWSEDCISTGALTAQVTMDADKTCTATFGYPVGGIVVPVNKLGLVAPWMGLAALATFAALTVALVRRRRG